MFILNREPRLYKPVLFELREKMGYWVKRRIRKTLATRTRIVDNNLGWNSIYNLNKGKIN